MVSSLAYRRTRELDPAEANCSNVCVGEIVRMRECVYGGGSNLYLQDCYLACRGFLHECLFFT